MNHPFAGDVPGDFNEFLADLGDECRLRNMKTLTVEEATSGLAQLVELALAGEQIQIRQGERAVELRPANRTQPEAPEPMTPREALRRLQEEARLTSEQADRYLCEVREERLATESKCRP